jgi:hypothetical protein
LESEVEDVVVVVELADVADFDSDFDSELFDSELFDSDVFDSEPFDSAPPFFPGAEPL